MSNTLSKDYILELLKVCFSSNKILEICAKHLKYEFLQTEAQKKVAKYIFESFHVTGNSPTIGMVGQAYSGNKEVIALLNKMKQVNVMGKEDQILNSFESFIKDIRFQILLKKVADLYNAGKIDESQKELAKESKAIAEFTLKDRMYSKVFDGFDDRMKKREMAALQEVGKKREKLTTGIHELDFFTKGGYRRGTSFLAMARSGMGKSTYLRWVALCNARLGKRVVIFQGEDTEDNAMEAMDSAWTSIAGDDLEEGNIPRHMRSKLRQIQAEIKARGGEVILVASEQFNKLSIEECREKLIDIMKVEGDVDMVLFDYLEIFTSKGQYSKGEGSERRRREDIANNITNLAVEFNIVAGTATQSADIDLEKLNNPDFKMTRHHASEFKNIVKPFSYFFTFNATEEEYEQQILRIYTDKFRKHRSGQTIRIYQSRENGRFYDAVRTKETFGNAAFN